MSIPTTVDMTMEQQARASALAFLAEHRLSPHPLHDVEWRPAYEYQHSPELVPLLGPTGTVPNTVDVTLATRDDVLAAGKALGVEAHEAVWIDEQPGVWHVYRRAAVTVDNWLPGVRLDIGYHERRTARPDRSTRRRRAS